MLHSINLQKSLEKLTILNMLQEKLDGNTTLIAMALSRTVNNSAESIIKTCKDCIVDNRAMMVGIIGEVLVEKIEMI